MGDRTQQGDLFGIKNLLTFQRDASDVLQKSGTREIISDGRTAFDHEPDEGGFDHEPDEGGELGEGFVIRRVARPDDEQEGEGDALGGKDLGAEQDVEWLLSKVEAESGNKHSTEEEEAPTDEGSEEQIVSVLRKAGAVHSHLNSSVLGGMPLSQFAKKTAAGGSVAVPKAEPGAPAGKRKATAEQEPATAEPATAKRPAPSKPAEADSMEACSAPRDVADCLCGSRFFQDYIRRLHTEANVAWRAEYCREVLGAADELARVVSALPDEP